MDTQRILALFEKVEDLRTKGKLNIEIVQSGGPVLTSQEKLDIERLLVLSLLQDILFLKSIALFGGKR